MSDCIAGGSMCAPRCAAGGSPNTSDGSPAAAAATARLVSGGSNTLSVGGASELVTPAVRFPEGCAALQPAGKCAAGRHHTAPLRKTGEPERGGVQS
jgi:hypothetical protein